MRSARLSSLIAVAVARFGYGQQDADGARWEASPAASDTAAVGQTGIARNACI